MRKGGQFGVRVARGDQRCVTAQILESVRLFLALARGECFLKRYFIGVDPLE